MDGFFSDGYIMYGWCDHDTDRVIRDSWLEKHGVRVYPGSVARCFATSFVYGVHCGFDGSTGQACVNPDDKENVKKAAIKAGISENELEFYLAQHGDHYTIDASPYTPDEDDSSG